MSAPLEHLTLTVERGQGGWYYVQSPDRDLRGLLVAAPSMAEALSGVVVALARLRGEPMP